MNPPESALLQLIPFSVFLVMAAGVLYLFFRKGPAPQGGQSIPAEEFEDAWLPRLAEPPQTSIAESPFFPFENGWPCKVISVPGEKALEERDRLQGEFESKGLWPVIIGSLRGITPTYSEEVMQEVNDAFPAILEASYSRNLEKHFQTMEEAIERAVAVFKPGKVNRKPDREQQMGITAHTNLTTRKPLEQVMIALLPIKASYEAPAYLNFGGWNSCPSADALTAFFRRWQKAYGAEVVAFSDDTIECIVSRLPDSEEGAYRLALEQYHFCSDIVLQGTDSVDALAATLMYSKTWFFWWD